MAANRPVIASIAERIAPRFHIGILSTANNAVRRQEKNLTLSLARTRVHCVADTSTKPIAETEMRHRLSDYERSPRDELRKSFVLLTSGTRAHTVRGILGKTTPS